MRTETHGLGPFYAALGRYPAPGPAPIADWGWSNATEPPWRYGQCLVVRIWPTRAVLVLGWWRERRQGLLPLRRVGDEADERMLLRVLDARAMPEEDIAAWDC